MLFYRCCFYRTSGSSWALSSIPSFKGYSTMQSIRHFDVLIKVPHLIFDGGINQGSNMEAFGSNVTGMCGSPED
jgi:hypothetical protein